MAMLESVSDALMSLDYAAKDGATVALAGKLAQEIDASGDAKVIGDLCSRLLTVLIALGMTPTSRSVIAKGVGAHDTAPSPAKTLDELRARRARAHGTTTLDPSS